MINGHFGPGLFKIKGGIALYDQVYMVDGGSAAYLVRIDAELHVTKRYIGWDTPLVQMYKPK